MPKRSFVLTCVVPFLSSTFFVILTCLLRNVKIAQLVVFLGLLMTPSLSNDLVNGWVSKSRLLSNCVCWSSPSQQKKTHLAFHVRGCEERCCNVSFTLHSEKITPAEDAYLLQLAGYVLYLVCLVHEVLLPHWSAYSSSESRIPFLVHLFTKVNFTCQLTLALVRFLCSVLQHLNISFCWACPGSTALIQYIFWFYVTLMSVMQSA